MTTEFGKVAVLMGGKSAEREISNLTGQAILTALLAKDIDAVGIDTAHPAFITHLTETPFDRVFIALHGRGGEDGTVQGLLEQIGISYTGSGVLGSALAMDKYRTKQIWAATGLPTPPYCNVFPDSDMAQIAEQLGLPIMIKPVLEGSSLGMTKVNHIDKLAEAVEIAAQYNCDVMAEHYIKGLEYTAAIVHNTNLPLIRLETPRDFYDFTAKYSDTKTSYICPCGLPPAQEKALTTLACQAFSSIGGSGWGRVDFLCDESGQPWLIEANTVPGMTDHSLVPMAAKTAGINFEELVLRILATA
jgi:D-alanine-D-alanine ligase